MKWCRKLQITHASMAQRVEYQIEMAEVLGSMLTGITFCCWIFFHKVKPLMPTLAIIAKSVFLKNTSKRQVIPGAGCPWKIFIYWGQGRLWGGGGGEIKSVQLGTHFLFHRYSRHSVGDAAFVSNTDLTRRPPPPPTGAQYGPRTFLIWGLGVRCWSQLLTLRPNLPNTKIPHAGGRGLLT